MFEWMWNALFFFWSDIFPFWDLVFFGILKDLFFSCLGISCLLIFEWMWNALFFFLVQHFSILGLSIFGDIKNLFFSLLGISCLLIFEWIRNALLFFWPLIFLFQHLLKFRYFSEHETTTFLAHWEFRVYSYLSGFGSLIFFLARHFFHSNTC